MPPVSISSPSSLSPSYKSIDLSSALRSSLRVWLATRDAALWAFTAGADMEDGAASEIGVIDPEELKPFIKRMNQARASVYAFATQLHPRSPETAIRAEVEALLSEEKPKFLLKVEGIEGSF